MTSQDFIAVNDIFISLGINDKKCDGIFKISV